MAAIVATFGKLVGNFRVEMNYDRDENDFHELNTLGRMVNNIVSRCTFRPPKTASEIRLEYKLLEHQNSMLGEYGFEDLRNPPRTLQGHYDTPEHSEICRKGCLLKIQAAELQRHQENFNPVGGLAAAGVVILLAYSVANWVGNTFIPYMIRNNFKLGAKCMAGATILMLTKESVEGWSRLTDGKQRQPVRRCGVEE